MKIYMIRHGATKGNKEHRYIGVTDEPLLPEEKQLLAKKTLPSVARVYVSPKKRCLETAAILYPDCQPIVKERLTECDFGEFENCNYEELNGNPFYQKFIDSMGMSGFPQGEDRMTFQKRVVSGFLEIMEKERSHKNEDIAFVVHGGTIMAILDFCQRSSEAAVPFYGLGNCDSRLSWQGVFGHGKTSHLFYKWQVGNGEGYMADVVWREEGDGFHLENIGGLPWKGEC